MQQHRHISDPDEKSVPSGEAPGDEELRDAETDAETDADTDDEDIADDEVELEDAEAVDDDFTLPMPANPGGLVSRDPLQLYLREVQRFPLVTPEEEVALAQRVRDHGDSEAAFRLVSSHLRLVVRIAMDFQRRWMQNVLDLIQEGNVGLMRAVQKFDPDKGIKFSYYASFWIRAYILKFIMDNWRMVKVGTTQAQRKLFYNLNKERQRLKTLGFNPDTATLAKNLGVSEDVVSEMDQRLAKQDLSLDMHVGEDGGATHMDFLPALEPGIEDRLAKDEIAGMVQENVRSLLPTLNDKERDILQERLLTDSPVTLREIGERYGITRERVRQIEARLLEKLKEHMADSLEDFSADWISRDA